MSRARRPAATWASAVPQAPPPITASCSIVMPSPLPRAPFPRFVERPARPRRRVEPVDQPGGEALGARPADHRRIVGAQPARRDPESAAIARLPSLPAPSAAPGWRRRRRRRPGSAHRCCPSAGVVRSTMQSTTACWKLAAISAGRCLPRATARWTALFRPAKEKCGSLLPTKGRGSGTAFGSPSCGQRLDRRAAGVGEAEQFGGLVERFARRVVDGRRQPAIIADAAHFEQLAMAAAGKQQQIGKVQVRIDQPRATAHGLRDG